MEMDDAHVGEEEPAEGAITASAAAPAALGRPFVPPAAVSDGPKPTFAEQIDPSFVVPQRLQVGARHHAPRRPRDAVAAARARPAAARSRSTLPPPPSPPAPIAAARVRRRSRTS